MTDDEGDRIGELAAAIRTYSAVGRDATRSTTTKASIRSRTTASSCSPLDIRLSPCPQLGRSRYGAREDRGLHAALAKPVRGESSVAGADGSGGNVAGPSRTLRRLRMMAAPVLIGAILVAGWLLIGPLLTIPRFSTATGPVVRNGVAAIVDCGKKQGMAEE